MALVTAAEIKAIIPEITGTTDDAALGVLADGIGAAFARFCGYPPASASATPTMESTSYTLYLTGTGGRDLYLPIRPTTAVASVYDDPDLDFTSSTYLVSSSDYAIVWDPRRGSVLRLTSTATWGVWSDIPGGIKVACTAGFTAIDPALKALAEMAVRNWSDLKQTRGKRSVSVGPATTSFVDEALLPAHVRIGLGPYQLPSVAVG